MINLAKLKTNTQMLLTLGVKNLFGCIVRLQKPEWHLRAGVDREMFAPLLVQIHYAIAPAATIIDGVLAMEGQGPGRSGTPRQIGTLIGGRDAAAVDAAVCRMLKLAPEKNDNRFIVARFNHFRSLSLSSLTRGARRHSEVTKIVRPSAPKHMASACFIFGRGISSGGRPNDRSQLSPVGTLGTSLTY